jgi:hypothetical protein
MSKKRLRFDPEKCKYFTNLCKNKKNKIKHIGQGACAEYAFFK